MIGKICGTINFQKMITECLTPEGISYEVKIERTTNNERSRANPEKRFSDDKGVGGFEDRLNLVNQKDIEWLAWNWRIMDKL